MSISADNAQSWELKQAIAALETAKGWPTPAYKLIKWYNEHALAALADAQDEGKEKP